MIEPGLVGNPSETGRAVAISSLVALAFAAFMLRSDIKGFLWVHPWWQSFIAALPAIALVVVACLELRHSGEANRLRTEANGLQDRIGELEAERNIQLQQIAENTKSQLRRLKEMPLPFVSICVPKWRW